MKKGLLLASIAAAGLVLAGCSHISSSPTIPTGGTNTGTTPTAAEKQGETSITGTISQTGQTFYITRPGGTPEEIESYSVTLSDYVGQTVTVTGKYSGDTLFVGSIE